MPSKITLLTNELLFNLIIDLLYADSHFQASNNLFQSPQTGGYLLFFQSRYYHIICYVSTNHWLCFCIKVKGVLRSRKYPIALLHALTQPLLYWCCLDDGNRWVDACFQSNAVFLTHHGAPQKFVDLEKKHPPYLTKTYRDAIKSVQIRSIKRREKACE